MGKSRLEERGRGVEGKDLPSSGRPDPGELLRGTPEEVLARLMADDPLGLASRVRRHLRSRRFLMDDHRLVLATASALARNAPRYRGRPTLDRWVERHIETCVEQERASEGDRFPSSPGKRWQEMAERFGLDMEELDAACRRFHSMSFESRDAFFRLVMDRSPIESLVHCGGRHASDIAKDARRALAHFLRLRPHRRTRNDP